MQPVPAQLHQLPWRPGGRSFPWRHDGTQERYGCDRKLCPTRCNSQVRRLLFRMEKCNWRCGRKLAVCHEMLNGRDGRHQCDASGDTPSGTQREFQDPDASRAARSHFAELAAASYVLSRKSNSAASGSDALRMASYGNTNSPKSLLYDAPAG